MQRTISRLVRHGKTLNYTTPLVRKEVRIPLVVEVVQHQVVRWKFSSGSGGAMARGVKGIKGRKFNVNQKEDVADDEAVENGAEGDGKEFSIDDRFVWRNDLVNVN